MAKLRDKIDLLRGLLGNGVAYCGPFYVCIRITQRCNLSCPWCRFQSSVPDIKSPRQKHDILDFPLPLFKQLCRELRGMGTQTLVFTGDGEPLMNPHLLDMVSVAKKAGFQIILITNGTLLNTEVLHALVDLKLDILRVSLWCSSKEAYVQTYPGADPDNYDRILAALVKAASIKRAQGSNLPCVQITHPITRLNYRRLDGVVDLVQRTGCNVLKFSPLRTHGGKLASQSLRPDEEKYVHLALSETAKRLKSFNITHNIDETLLRYQFGEAVWQKLPCYMGWVWAQVRANGTVLACNVCELPIGNLNEHSFQHIWNDTAAQNARRQMLTRDGLEAMGERCDCGYCCNALDNWRIQKVFRWLSPLRRIR